MVFIMVNFETATLLALWSLYAELVVFELYHSVPSALHPDLLVSPHLSCLLVVRVLQMQLVCAVLRRQR